MNYLFILFLILRQNIWSWWLHVKQWNAGGIFMVFIGFFVVFGHPFSS